MNIPAVEPATAALSPAFRPAIEPTVGARILLADPDPEVEATAAIRMLRHNGLAIERAAPDDSALGALAGGDYALVVLDHREADAGLELCRRMLELQAAPVIIWSARAGPLDQVAGLELGAEDVIAKSAHPLELLARIRAALRRSAPPAAAQGERLAAHSWIFEPQANGLRSWRDQRAWLRPAAADLLRLMCERPRRLLRREDLGAAGAAETPGPALRTVDVMVSRLRRALRDCDGADDMVRTVRGGYLFNAAVTPIEAGYRISR